MKKNIGLFVLLASLLMVSSVRAEVPFLLPVVGHLTDASDAPITGSNDVVFRVYLLQTGGSAVWAETFDSAHPDGQVAFNDDGLFHVYLGNDPSNVLDLADFVDNDELWLGIQVGTDNEMSRIRLASVPWAFEAEVCREIDDLDAAGIQAAIDAACPAGQFMNGYDATGASCDVITLPATVLETSDIGTSVQAAVDTSTPCNYGISTIEPGTGATTCATQDVVNDCGPLAGGGSDDNYLGSDGDCHPAPHSCEANHTVSGSTGECQGTVPTGAVMFFNLASCPSGWTELTAARGRVPMGLPSGGTLAGTSGTPYVDLEVRSHNHGGTLTSSSDGAHSHRWSYITADNNWYAYDDTSNGTTQVENWGDGIGSDGDGHYPFGIGYDPGTTHSYYTQNLGNHTHTVDVSWQDYSMPYIQLLACQKD